MLIKISQQPFAHGSHDRLRVKLNPFRGVFLVPHAHDLVDVAVTAIAEVMSQAFAERHRILALEVNEDEVVIASGEPYIRAWESNLEHVLRKPIRRVLADPRDIARHTAEFYTMAGSVRGARGSCASCSPKARFWWSREWRSASGWAGTASA